MIFYPFDTLEYAASGTSNISTSSLSRGTSIQSRKSLCSHRSTSERSSNSTSDHIRRMSSMTQDIGNDEVDVDDASDGTDTTQTYLSQHESSRTRLKNNIKKVLSMFSNVINRADIEAVYGPYVFHLLFLSIYTAIIVFVCWVLFNPSRESSQCLDCHHTMDRPSNQHQRDYSSETLTTLQSLLAWNDPDLVETLEQISVALQGFGQQAKILSDTINKSLSVNGHEDKPL